jgi:hypothetical protein
LDKTELDTATGIPTWIIEDGSGVIDQHPPD